MRTLAPTHAPSAPTILFVTDIQIYPIVGGQMLHAYNMLDLLSRRYEVVVIAPAIDPACALVNQVAAWYTMPVDTYLKPRKLFNYLFRLLPRPSWVAMLRQVCEKHQPALVWFNYAYWGQYVEVARACGALTVMQTHNAQAQLSKQQAYAAPIGPTRAIEWLRYRIERVHERRLFPQFDRILSVSEADRRYHAQYVGEARSLFLPNFINEANYQRPVRQPTAGNAPPSLVMTGSFVNFQNRHGIEWFLAEVWPLLIKTAPELQLHVVGIGSDACFGDQPPANVHAHGTVLDATPFLQQATVAIVPLRHGSGTRLKILEAWACGTPVVSTTLGAEGLTFISGEQGILADNGADFAQAILRLLNDEMLRQRCIAGGAAELAHHFGFAANMPRVESVVEELLAARAKVNSMQ